MGEKDLAEHVQPFSNGSEYTNWLFNNCSRCKWGSDNNNCVSICAVEYSLTRARYKDRLVGQWFVYVAGIGKDGKCKVKESNK